MVLYTLYFIFYSVYTFSLSLRSQTHLSSLFLRLLRPSRLLRCSYVPRPRFLLAARRRQRRRRGCMQNAHAARFSERRYYAVGVLALVPTSPLSTRTHSLSTPRFFSIFLCLSLSPSFFSTLPLTHSFVLTLLLLVRPRIVGETFFRSITFIGRPPFVRAPAPRYYPLINCREKREKKIKRGKE